MQFFSTTSHSHPKNITWTTRHNTRQKTLLFFSELSWTPTRKSSEQEEKNKKTFFFLFRFMADYYDYWTWWLIIQLNQHIFYDNACCAWRYRHTIRLIYRISLKGGEFFMAKLRCYLLLTITNSLRPTFSRERTLPRRQMLLCFTDHPSSFSLPSSLFPWDEIRWVLTREKKYCVLQKHSAI